MYNLDNVFYNYISQSPFSINTISYKFHCLLRV